MRAFAAVRLPKGGWEGQDRLTKVTTQLDHAIKIFGRKVIVINLFSEIKCWAGVARLPRAAVRLRTQGGREGQGRVRRRAVRGAQAGALKFPCLVYV